MASEPWMTEVPEINSHDRSCLDEWHRRKDAFPSDKTYTEYALVYRESQLTLATSQVKELLERVRELEAREAR